MCDSEGVCADREGVCVLTVKGVWWLVRLC